MKGFLKRDTRRIGDTVEVLRQRLSGERGSNDLETHGIEILDEPGQIVALKPRNEVLIFSPTKKADKLVMKLGRSSVEVAEWFQAVVWDHRNLWDGQRPQGNGMSSNV